MNLILFDDIRFRDNLKPLVHTRPVSGLRCGILTIQEKWTQRLNTQASFLSEAYLALKYPVYYTDNNLYINASVLPDAGLLKAISDLGHEKTLVKDSVLLAYKTGKRLAFGFAPGSDKVEYSSEVNLITELPHLYLKNGSQIEADYQLLTLGKSSQAVSDPFTAVYNPENVFIGKYVSIRAAIINAEAGPVFIGDNAIIQDGAIIIGPAAIGENAMVAYGAKIRANTTLGPVCRVGGEVSNAIFHAFANKAHAGFLGNSYIGEWCNLGANTNNSNLKNNYKSVKIYNYGLNALYDTGELFCGTFMGDFTKAAISTMFNTGTVVGVCSNVFGAGFQQKYIPDFSWGGNETYESYKFDKAMEVIGATMSRRQMQLTKNEVSILKHISEKF